MKKKNTAAINTKIHIFLLLRSQYTEWDEWNRIEMEWMVLKIRNIIFLKWHHMMLIGGEKWKEKIIKSMNCSNI